MTVLSGQMAVRGIGYGYREQTPLDLAPRCEPWTELPIHWANRVLICETVSPEAGL